jgi:hypothetical protein
MMPANDSRSQMHPRVVTVHAVVDPTGQKIYRLKGLSIDMIGSKSLMRGKENGAADR